MWHHWSHLKGFWCNHMLYPFHHYEDLGENFPDHGMRGSELHQLHSVGFLLLALYMVLLVSAFGVRFIYRINKNQGEKPVLASLLDTLLDIPYLMRLGPWAKENGIFHAMERAMDETKLFDFGNGVGMGEEASVWHDGDAGAGTSAAVKSSVLAHIGVSILGQAKAVEQNRKDQNNDPYGFIHRYDVALKQGVRQVKAQYSPLGYLLSFQTLYMRMKQRLLHVDYMKRHPKISQVDVKNPIFVIGFPRTGTTFLHELLGLHPDLKMHYTWEQMEHVPNTHSEDPSALSQDRKERYNKNKKRFQLNMAFVGDAIQSIHRIGYDDPEECTTPCAFELPYALGALPLYIFAAEKSLPLGCGRAFDYYKEYLQILTWQSQAESPSTEPASMGAHCNWMLKCPFHLPYLQELFDTFPDATVVWTHRNPVECIASACSLYYRLLLMGCEASSINKNDIGRLVLKYTVVSLDKAQEFLSSQHVRGKKVVHVRYQDTVGNSLQAVQTILNQLGSLNADSGRSPAQRKEVSHEYQAAVKKYLEKSLAKRARKSREKSSGGNRQQLHSYSLAEYGLDAESVKSTFATYIQTYNL